MECFTLTPSDECLDELETLQRHCNNKGAFGDLDGPFDWYTECDIVESLMKAIDLLFREDMKTLNTYEEDRKSWNPVDMSNFPDSIAPEDMCMVWETSDDGDCED